METRANYALIGLFTLAVIASGFLFVFWVSGTGRTADEKTYKVVFTGSVTGLASGGWVLFNGVRVGEVKSIDLMPNDPSQVYALVNVQSRVPVRADTKARLEELIHPEPEPEPEDEQAVKPHLIRLTDVADNVE